MMNRKFARTILPIALALVLTLTITGIAIAATDPEHVQFTLEGCRNPSVDLETTNFVCADADYTTGNLGKTWNELDLVPHRVTTSLGNQANATTQFTIAIVADHIDGGNFGYDFISVPVVNTTKSDASCAVTAGALQTETPGIGGTDTSMYRLITISQNKGTTCVFDYVERLALGAAQYPGSSLHSNLTNQSLSEQGVGNKDVSIPVKEILPQELNKDMAATRDADHVWNVTKAPTPAEVSFPNTCDPDAPTGLGVQITVEWERLPASPSGEVTIVTNVYATNPSHRTITVDVTDQIYEGTDQTTPVGAPANSGPVDVPANTTQLVLTNSVTVSSSATHFNDVATATYTDKVTGVPVPGQTQAMAEADVQSGTTTNTTATINDLESVTGANFSYSTDAFSGASGAFDGGYVAGTQTTGSVSWTSASQSNSGSVTFDKTIYVSPATSGTATLDDTATLNASDGFTTDTSATINISSSAQVSLTINKTIPDTLTGSGTQTFTFQVKDSNDVVVASPSITFEAGETSDSTTVSGLAPGSYTVSEDPATGWENQANQPVNINLPSCSGSVTFNNTLTPANAEVKKVTVPAGFEANWTFDLKDGNGTTLETKTSTGAGAVSFDTDLGEGSYSIVEHTQDGWQSNGGDAACSFTVDLPADAGKVFSCTFTNTYQPSVDISKTGDELSKIGDSVTYIIDVENTSSAGGAAGAPDLVCDVSDATISFSQTVTLPAGSSDSFTVPFTIPQSAADPFDNTASIDCHYPGLADVVASSESTWSTNLFQPSIKVTKTGPAYSKEGDTATYNVTIENTSSADSPNLVFDSFSDTLVAGVTPPATCDTLAFGGNCSLSYSYTVQGTDPDPLLNTATAHYHPAGFPNDITDDATASVDLLHPSFTVTKACKAEPISQAGPAVFTITFNNTGDADLHVVPSEGSAFDVAAGGTHSYDYSVTGPFTATVENTVTGTVTLASQYGLSNSYTFSANDSCNVKGKANVVKTVSGQAPAAGQTFTFELRQGASPTSDGTVLETKSTDASGNISFSTELVPGQTYQICEWVFPGWNTNLAGDEALFVPNSMIPPSLPNPNVNNLVVCANFTVTSGQTRTFTVDNTPPPGGRALTIGFWKNWASCSNSNGRGQKAMLDLALGIASATTTNPPGGLVVSADAGVWPNYAPVYDLILKGDPTSTLNNIKPASGCLWAIRLLDKSRIDNGRKMASDPLFNMTAQLVAAQLNRFMGAGISGATITNIDKAVLLNGANTFNGKTHDSLTASETALANCLATQLDNYNNNRPVSACP